MKLRPVILILIPLLAVFVSAGASADTKGYRKNCLEGAGCMDAIDGAALGDGDHCYVAYGGHQYLYVLDADSAASESGVEIIAPSANAGDKRWIRQDAYRAAAGDSATSFFSEGTVEAARLPVVSDSTAGVLPTTSGASDGYAAIVQGDGSIAYEVMGAVGVGKHMAKIARNAAQSISSGSETKIAFDTVQYDNAGMADVTTNDRITIQRDGKYLVCAISSLGGIDDSEYADIRVTKNGSPNYILYLAIASPVANQTVSPHRCEPVDLSAGDYIELFVYHNEGASQDTKTDVWNRSSLSVVQIDGVASGDRGPASVTCADATDTCAYTEGFGSYYLTSGSDSTADAMTISDGFAGQKILFKMKTDGGDDISVEFTNGTDCDDFTAAGDFCFAEFDGTNWFIINQGP